MPRTRGALSGLLLVVLGAWGAVIAFVGPYFSYAYTPDSTWTYTSDRLWLEILPGAGAFLGGLLVLGSANRAVASFGGWLAALSGAWFVIGLPLSALSGMPSPGTPIGGTTRRVLETLGFFSALGVVITFLAALALGRFAVIGVREIRSAERLEAEQRLSVMDSGVAAAPGSTRGPAAPAAPVEGPAVAPQAPVGPDARRQGGLTGTTPTVGSTSGSRDALPSAPPVTGGGTQSEPGAVATDDEAGLPWRRRHFRRRHAAAHAGGRVDQP